MQKFFIVAKAKDNTPEILVYGIIGSDDANSTDFIKAIKELEKKHHKINVRINSEGGSVLQGLAMYAAIVNSPAEINTYIDGFAASMAAVLAMAGKKIYMSKYARLMTHCASSALGGNADEMRSTAKFLDSLDHTMCVIYANRTGKTPEQCLKDYVSRKGDKFFTAAEALDDKLIDGIYDGEALQVPANATAATLWSFYNEHKFAAILNQSQKQNENMKDLKLSAASLAALNITAVAPEAITDTVIDTAIAALKVKADQADTYKADKETAVAALATEKAANVKADVTGQLKNALDVVKNITKEQHDLFATQYDGKPVELKALLATMKPFASVLTNTELSADDKTELGKLAAMSGDELFNNGKLDRLKELNGEAGTIFLAKYKEAFKEDYKAPVK